MARPDELKTLPISRHDTGTARSPRSVFPCDDYTLFFNVNTRHSPCTSGKNLTVPPSNSSPEPATRSFTVRETRISLGDAPSAILWARLTAKPLYLLSTTSHSPVW